MSQDLKPTKTIVFDPSHFHCKFIPLHYKDFDCLYALIIIPSELWKFWTSAASAMSPGACVESRGHNCVTIA